MGGVISTPFFECGNKKSDTILCITFCYFRTNDAKIVQKYHFSKKKLLRTFTKSYIYI